MPKCLRFNKLHTPAVPPDRAVPCLAWFHALLQRHRPPASNAPLFQTMVETPQRGLPSVLFLLVRACYSIKMRDPCLFPFDLYWPYVLLWSTECDKSPEWELPRPGKTSCHVGSQITLRTPCCKEAHANHVGRQHDGAPSRQTCEHAFLDLPAQLPAECFQVLQLTPLGEENCSNECRIMKNNKLLFQATVLRSFVLQE